MWTGVVEHAGQPVARWAFSDARSGGLSPLGRQQLADAVRVPVGRLIWPGVCHSADVGVVTHPVELVPRVDGLVSCLPQVGLVTLGADCVPLLAVDPQARVVLSAHIGWRGAAAGMADSIVAALLERGGSPAACRILLGPSICGECYRVDEARRTAVAAALPMSRTEFGLDLREGLRGYFTDVDARVQLVGGCTAESAQLHSFRRDGSSQRQTAAVVLL